MIKKEIVDGKIKLTHPSKTVTILTLEQLEKHISQVEEHIDTTKQNLLLWKQDADSIRKA